MNPLLVSAAPMLCCLVFGTGLPLRAQSNPIKLSPATRIDLFAGSSVGSLTDGALLQGDGSVSRQVWRPSAEQPRTYTVEMPVVRYAWTEYRFRFTPQNSGTVTLMLMSPWLETSPGSGLIYRQEVLFDALEADGVQIFNGGFESVTSSGTIQGWNGGISQPTTASVQPVEGARMARVWHDGAMNRSLSVSAGTPVTLRFYSRAVVPVDFQEMARLQGATPAHQAALRFMRGINFGNFLEAPPGTWGLDYSESDFRLARAEGFDHVRLPVAWHLYTGPAPNYLLASGIFTQVDRMLEHASTHGLGMILDWHHFDDFTSVPASHLDRFLAVWRQIAQRYRNAPDTVAFELLNEPKDNATTTYLNRTYPQVVQAIRQSNPGRTLFIGPGNFNSVDELSGLLLPDDDPNLITTVHIYDPFLFTHQGATWTGSETRTTGIVFPGPPSVPRQPHSQVTQGWARSWFEAYNSLPAEYNPGGPAAFRGKIERARQWAEYFGRPVHVGEFGCYETADAASRVRFYQAIRESMDEAGLGWAMWDWKAGFHYMLNGSPNPSGMRAAIFPDIAMESLAPGSFRARAARGKVFRIQRTSTLRTPPAWNTVAEETLAGPDLLFIDPDGDEAPAAYYRLEWIR